MAQRATLGSARKAIGRKLLEKYAAIATPDTILRWPRQRIALKWPFAAAATRKRVGRSRTAPEIEQLVIQIAKENSSWGYDRIAGALVNPGHEIAATTVGEILASNGVPPAPRRRSTWTIHQVAPGHARGRRHLHDRSVAQTRTHDGLHALRHPARIDNKIIEPGPELGASVGKIDRVVRLGGLLRYYRRFAD